MVTYEWIKDNLVAVFFDGKRVGKIKKDSDGWSYHPKGHIHGDPFPTLEECKKSLGGE